MSKISMVQALNRAIDEAMAEDEGVMDIAHFVRSESRVSIRRLTGDGSPYLNDSQLVAESGKTGEELAAGVGDHAAAIEEPLHAVGMCKHDEIAANHRRRGSPRRWARCSAVTSRRSAS